MPTINLVECTRIHFEAIYRNLMVMEHAEGQRKPSHSFTSTAAIPEPGWDYVAIPGLLNPLPQDKKMKPSVVSEHRSPLHL